MSPQPPPRHPMEQVDEGISEQDYLMSDRPISPAAIPDQTPDDQRGQPTHPFDSARQAHHAAPEVPDPRRPVRELLERNRTYNNSRMGSNTFTRNMLHHLTTYPEAELDSFYPQLEQIITEYIEVSLRQDESDRTAAATAARQLSDDSPSVHNFITQDSTTSRVMHRPDRASARSRSRSRSRSPQPRDRRRVARRHGPYLVPARVRAANPSAPYATSYAAYGHVADPIAARQDDPERIRRAHEELPPPTYMERVHDELVPEAEVSPPRYDSVMEGVHDELVPETEGPPPRYDSVMERETTPPTATVSNATVPTATITTTAVPNTTAPNTTVSQAPVPSATIPTAVVPDTTAPNTTVSHATVPNTTTPRASTAEAEPRLPTLTPLEEFRRINRARIQMMTMAVMGPLPLTYTPRDEDDDVVTERRTHPGQILPSWYSDPNATSFPPLRPWSESASDADDEEEENEGGDEGDGGGHERVDFGEDSSEDEGEY